MAACIGILGNLFKKRTSYESQIKEEMLFFLVNLQESLENCRKKVQNRTNTVKLCFERKSLCQSAGY